MERIMTCSKEWMIAHYNNFVSGVIMTVFSYFAPVKGVVIVALAAIALDFVTGILASVALKKGIKSIKMWRTLWKMLCVLSIIMLTYAIDKEFQIIEIHRIVAWVVVGFELWSILENMAKITDHKVFRILKRFMEDKIEDVSGVEMDENGNPRKDRRRRHERGRYEEYSQEDSESI